MKVVGRQRLTQFVASHAEVRSQIDAWLCEVEEARWRTPHELKQRYPTASPLGEHGWIFNLKGNKYRLETKISFKNQVIVVMWIGTHAEYTKRMS